MGFGEAGGGVVCVCVCVERCDDGASRMLYGAMLRSVGLGRACFFGLNTSLVSGWDRERLSSAALCFLVSIGEGGGGAFVVPISFKPFSETLHVS